MTIVMHAYILVWTSTNDYNQISNAYKNNILEIIIEKLMQYYKK